MIFSRNEAIICFEHDYSLILAAVTYSFLRKGQLFMKIMVARDFSIAK
jgi:hypothetical protein